MCGIGGVFQHDSARPIDPAVLIAMAAIQSHRGPDGCGWKTINDRGVGFTHARLAIIDLNADRARQPFVSDNPQIMIAHNGEFYDYKRIRADLTSRGYRFNTKSDTELLMHLTDRFGLEGAMTHLRGEFGFAVHEKKYDRLTLVRDRFGIKPLFWTMTPEGVVFGSEIKVLFSHPAVKRKISPHGLYHQLMQFARAIWHTERSIHNTFTISKMLLSEHVQKAGYRVVLTGEGSDELFAGYPQLRLDIAILNDM
ncbi:MAG: hypothetical protein C4288_17455 [Leptolyngbya sp. ERB_1_1]